MRIKVLGEDSMAESSAVVSAQEHDRFAFIARIICTRPDGVRISNTAFHVVEYHVLVTAAHAFRDPRSGVAFDRTQCAIHYYDHSGVEVEQAPVLFYRSRWDTADRDGDPNHDVALLKISKPAQSFSHIPPVKFGYGVGNGKTVSLIGYINDSAKYIKRRSVGKLYSISPSAQCRHWNNNAQGTYDSAPGTSGSPLFDEDGKIIGLHIGTCGLAGQDFVRDISYNAAFLFDDDWAEEVRRLARE